MNNIIFIDIDDTLCNTRQSIYDLYFKSTGDKTPYINKPSSKYYSKDCPKWSDEDISTLFNHYSNYIYNSAKPMPQTIESIEKLQNLGYNINVVSLHSPTDLSYKQQWINKYFPSLQDKVFIGTNTKGNKDIFKGFAIIDDDIKNIQTNLSMKTILYDYYNIYPSINSKFDNWNDIVDFLKN